MANQAIMVAVGAVIEDGQGRILLVKHVPERGGFWQGKWICPGGRLRWGESIEAGIRREVKEETNLEIALSHPLVPFDRVVTGHSGLHVIYIDYLARLIGGELRVGDDVGEALWVSRAELRRRWGELHEDTQRLLQIAGLPRPYRGLAEVCAPPNQRFGGEPLGPPRNHGFRGVTRSQP